jgi:hypothetical protein
LSDVVLEQNLRLQHDTDAGDGRLAHPSPLLTRNRDRPQAVRPKPRRPREPERKPTGWLNACRGHRSGQSEGPYL